MHLGYRENPKKDKIDFTSKVKIFIPIIILWNIKYIIEAKVIKKEEKRKKHFDDNFIQIAICIIVYEIKQISV